MTELFSCALLVHQRPTSSASLALSHPISSTFPEPDTADDWQLINSVKFSGYSRLKTQLSAGDVILIRRSSKDFELHNSYPGLICKLREESFIQSEADKTE